MLEWKAFGKTLVQTILVTILIQQVRQNGMYQAAHSFQFTRAVNLAVTGQDLFHERCPGTWHTNDKKWMFR